jgi:hypothetical protein
MQSSKIILDINVEGTDFSFLLSTLGPKSSLESVEHIEIPLGVWIWSCHILDLPWCFIGSMYSTCQLQCCGKNRSIMVGIQEESSKVASVICKLGMCDEQDGKDQIT